MKNNRVYFDNSLTKFISVIIKSFDQDFLNNNLILRDASGRLTLIIRENKYGADALENLKSTLEKKLFAYIDQGFSVCSAENLYDDFIGNMALDGNTLKSIKVNDKTIPFHFYERRIVGGDWQRYYGSYDGPARIVFASIKGGVGRSTALCVVASALAKSGKRVLAIDLDLEAPGLGNMLLTDDTLPAFGLLDFFVEQNLDNVTPEFIVDMIGSSWLSFGKGRIDVIPAIGKSSFDNPENVLAKISRAYLPGIARDGSTLTFMDHLRALLDSIDNKRYDAILIDSRAGLHETTASALVGLGAEIFCFGVDQYQTLNGYELLFSAISNNNFATNDSNKWIDKLNFVHAKATLDENKNRLFREKVGAIISKHFTSGSDIAEDVVDIESLKDSFEVEWNENFNNEIIDNIVLGEADAAFEINTIITVLDDERFKEFNPQSDQDSLSENVYSTTFNALINRVMTIVNE